jgi:hypothetical protein
MQQFIHFIIQFIHLQLLPHDLQTRFVTQPISREKGDDGFGIDNAVPGTDGRNQT